MDNRSQSPTVESEGCFICGESRPNGLEQHHIVPRRYGGTDSAENLVQLCASCHSAVEKLYDGRFYNEIYRVLDDGGHASWDNDLELKTAEAEDSLDRKIPITSPHIKYESESGGEWQEAIRQKKKLEGSYAIPGVTYRYDKKVKDAKLEDDRRQKLEKSQEWTVEKQEISITGVSDEDGVVDVSELLEYEKNPNTEKIWYKNKRPAPRERLRRIHCGYCNAWFEKYEHAGAARHLRVAHGMENPYKEPEQEQDRPPVGEIFHG